MTGREKEKYRKRKGEMIERWREREGKREIERLRNCLRRKMHSDAHTLILGNGRAKSE